MGNFLQAIGSTILSMWKSFALGVTTLFTPSRWAGIPRKLAQISIPGLVSTVVFLLLVAVAVIVIVILVADQGRRFFPLVWYREIPIIAILILVITMVTYYTVKLWMEGEGSPFEDIDRAWQAGLEALERHHLDLRQIPIFMVLGSEGPEPNRVLLGATRVSLAIDNVPPGPSALHWYANQEAIYLVCTEVGCLSQLAQRARHGGVASAAAPAARPRHDPRATLKPGEVQQAMASEPAESEEQQGGDGPAPNPGLDIRGTMVVAPANIRETIRPAAVAQAAGRTLALNRAEIELQGRRVAYLCRLIERHRRPLCGINGATTLIPAKLISADNANGTATTEAVRNDLNSLVAGLKLRFPVFALVTGMEEEKGFGELMRRVGRDSAQGQRFGSRFGLWDPPVDEEISALNNHACGAFEDWAYYLFKEPASLSKPGNRDLYTLLCKIRRTLQPRLEKILVGAYSMDEQQQGGSILFAGCYFAGTGEQAERQAFVRGVFDRFQDEQEELEWTEAALGEEGRYRTWSAIAFSTTALFLIGIGVVGWQLYTRK